jgi:hypothetical protein
VKLTLFRAWVIFSANSKGLHHSAWDLRLVNPKGQAERNDNSAFGLEGDAAGTSVDLKMARF